jgi:hypothetical protein
MALLKSVGEMGPLENDAWVPPSSRCDVTSQADTTGVMRTVEVDKTKT